MGKYIYENLRDLVKKASEKFPGQQFFISNDEEFPSVTAEEMYLFGGKLGRIFEKKKLEKPHVGILGNNCTAWIASYFAVIGAGGVSVPIPVGGSVEDYCYYVDKADCSILLYDEKQEKVVNEIAASHPGLECIGFHSFISELRSSTDMFFPEIDENDLAALYFTSGTTSKSRCVMLTHLNLVSDIIGSTDRIPVKRSDVLLAILPPTHTYEMLADVYFSLHYGCTTYINERISRLRHNLKEVQPTIIVVVPGILQTIYKDIMRKIEKSGKAALFRGERHLSHFALKFKINITRKMFAGIKNIFGGRLYEVICGGAALDEEIIRFFDDIGINIYQGYGITECSPVTAANSKRSNRIGTLGKPLNCNKVHIVDGEICFEGDNVSKGYYKDPELTEEYFRDGMFHTGDLGYVDRLGYIHFTGRIKNLIILSNGENVSPEELEEKLYRVLGVVDALVYGEDDRIVAEVFTDREIIPNEEAMLKYVKEINASLPAYKTIDRVKLRDIPFEKTMSNKIKRDNRMK